MSTRQRPLSPHLFSYRLQLTSLLSILNRITGSMLSVGAVGLVVWLLAAASGPAAFADAQAVLGSWLGYVVLFAFTLAFFYHLGGGLRHLMWDMGHGLDLQTTYKSGYAVIVATFLLTLLSWIVAMAVLA